jgi:hypothetical protein
MLQGAAQKAMSIYGSTVGNPAGYGVGYGAGYPAFVNSPQMPLSQQSPGMSSAGPSSTGYGNYSPGNYASSGWMPMSTGAISSQSTYGNPGNYSPYSPLPAPSYQAGGVQYAQSLPVSHQPAPFPPSVDVPPPHLVAPWVFYNPPRPQGMMGPSGNPNFQNNYYNNMYGQQQPNAGPYAPYPGYPYGPYGNPNDYGPTPSNQPPQPKTPDVQPPEVKTPDVKPPDAKTPDVKPPDAKTPDAKDPNNLDKIPNASVLTDEQVRSLNRQLSDPNATVRSAGAMDFFKILEANPDIANHPTYGPYVDAFVRKILGDPSPLVRQPLLLAMEMGYLKKVPESAIHILEKLSSGSGLWGQEPGIIRAVLPRLNQEEPVLPSTNAHPSLAGGEELGPPSGPVQPHFGHQQLSHRLNQVSDDRQFVHMAPEERRLGKRLNLLSSS